MHGGARPVRYAALKAVGGRGPVQENVLLDSEGHVKVTDFGLAKPGLSDDTRTNSFIGTMEVGEALPAHPCAHAGHALP